jgi:hypothetical protein
MFQQPNIQKIKVRGLCRPVDRVSASHPVFTKSLIQVLHDNAEEMTWCPITHEPYAVINEEAHVQRVLVDHSSKDDGTLRLLVF